MRLPKKGEKGFTLIELLIVVAILGVLAAVVIPNVGRFLGRGEEEARRTEFHNVTSAVVALMVDNGIATIPSSNNYTLPSGGAGNAKNAMGSFPDSTTTILAKATLAGYTWSGTGGTLGYVLYGNSKITSASTSSNVSYVSMTQTKYYYTCQSDGTIRQFKTADTSANEYTY